MGIKEPPSLMLAGIKDDKWANPPTTQCRNSILELIDRATMRDCRRSTATVDEMQSKHAGVQEKESQHKMSGAAMCFAFKKPFRQ